MAPATGATAVFAVVPRLESLVSWWRLRVSSVVIDRASRDRVSGSATVLAALLKTFGMRRAGADKVAAAPRIASNMAKRGLPH